MDEIEILDEEMPIQEPPHLDKKLYLIHHGVDLNMALEYLQDITLYDEIVATYLEEASEKMNKIENYKLQKNRKDYQIEVHSLKSDAKYLGLTKLASIAYEHELASKENNQEYIDSHFQDLLKEYQETWNMLKKYQEMLQI